jgi:hypothetical protein
MSNEFSSDSAGSNLERLESGDALKLLPEVPEHLQVLPDGRESLVAGDPEHCKDFNDRQDNNDLGFVNTCGIVSCEDILRQFGQEVTENDVLHYALQNGECFWSLEVPRVNGETTKESQAQILTDYGVPAHVETPESLEDLAGFVEQRHGVIAEVNAGVLWDGVVPDAAEHLEWGNANHAIVITGDARDPVTHQLQGFYTNDGATGQAGQFVDVEKMKLAWECPFGSGSGDCVVTDTVLT